MISRTGIATKLQLVHIDNALPGRELAIRPRAPHFVLGHSLLAPFPEGSRVVYFALGCFWGAERKFWQLDGVHTTAVGYLGGYTLNPSYDEVCSGRTAHTEAVLVCYFPDQIDLDELLSVFWESHDPCQGMQQGNDIGTQYRSAVFTSTGSVGSADIDKVESSLKRYQACLSAAGKGSITTEFGETDTFYYAEDYHQQYLAKNPNGYCGIGGCGVSYR